LGLVSEVGEILDYLYIKGYSQEKLDAYDVCDNIRSVAKRANILKKQMRDERVAIPNALDATFNPDELGDVLWYVVALVSDLDMRLRDVMEQNIAKLADRKARNVLHGSGDTR
jgi:NTP pyrophosphatase (non-canonical NTP hydrolase)